MPSRAVWLAGKKKAEDGEQSELGGEDPSDPEEQLNGEMGDDHS